MGEIRRGSCLCGTVSYSLNGPLRPMIVCHCIQCRKMSGHFTAATQSLASDVEIQGESLRWYRSSDIAERGFCVTCGGTLFWRRFDSPKISIYAGTLDGETGLEATAQIHADMKGDYYDLPNFPVIDQAELK
jgi:hypothetical protein